MKKTIFTFFIVILIFEISYSQDLMVNGKKISADYRDEVFYDLLDPHYAKVKDIGGFIRPPIIIHLAHIGGIDPENDKQMMEQIPRLWKEIYTDFTAPDDLSGVKEGKDWPPDAGMLQVAILANDQYFLRQCIIKGRNFKLDLNVKHKNGETILSWLRRIKKDGCKGRWCERALKRADFWEKFLLESGAKTNEELEAMEK